MYFGSRVTLVMPASLSPAGLRARVPLGSFHALKWNCLMPTHSQHSGSCKLMVTGAEARICMHSMNELNACCVQ